MGTALSHLFVHVTSLARSKAFYVDALGLEVLEGSAADGSGYLRVGGGDGFAMGLEERSREEVGAVGVEIVVRVADVDATTRQLRGAGLEIDTPPADQQWGMRHAWLRDPDGHRISIYSPISNHE